MTKLFFIYGVVAFAPYGAAVLYMFFSNIDFQLRVGGKVTGIKQTLISYDNKRLLSLLLLLIKHMLPVGTSTPYKWTQLIQSAH